jgi:hypothetical protein
VGLAQPGALSEHRTCLPHGHAMHVGLGQGKCHPLLSDWFAGFSPAVSYGVDHQKTHQLSRGAAEFELCLETDVGNK